MAGVTLELTVVEGAGDWIVRCRSRHGNVHLHVESPFAGEDVTDALHELELAFTRSHARLVTRRAESPDRTATRFGQRLAEVFKDSQIQVILDRCRAQARIDGSTVRVLLSTDGPTVSRIPWEFALDPHAGDFMALRLPVVRYLDVAAPMSPLAVELPLRVLGVQAQPVDVDPLEAAAERRGIEEAFARIGPEHVDVTWLPGDRWGELRKALAKDEWHALHFIGHGGYDKDAGEGFLQLSDAEGRAKRIHASDLARAIAGSARLRMVVLNACESAAGDGANIFASTAAAVMREGIPAVLAMQHEITDEAALTFASTFYEEVARESPVDVAVTRARVSVREEHRSLEWATPVLYLASEEAHLFRVGGRRRREPDPPTPAPPTPVPPAPAPVRPTSRDRVPERPPGFGATLRELTRTDPLGAMRNARIGPDGLVAAIGWDGAIRVHSSEDGRSVAHCPPHWGVACQVTWSPWRRYLASAQESGVVVIWDLDAREPTQVIQCGRSILSLALSHDGRLLATLHADRTVRVFDFHGQPIYARNVRANAASQFLTLSQPGPVLFSPDDRQLVVATNERRVLRLDAGGGLAGFWSHGDPISELALGEHGLASCSRSSRVHVWRWDGRTVIDGPTAAAADFVAMDDDGYVATASRAGSCELYAPNGMVLGTGRLAGRAGAVGMTASQITTVTPEGVVQTWARPRDTERS